MLKNIKKWIKCKLGITALEDQNRLLIERLNQHQDFVTAKVAELKDYTRVDADMGVRGNNTIILTGVYNGTAYVRFYDMGDGEFKRLADMLKDMKGHALIRHVDVPVCFSGVFRL